MEKSNYYCNFQKYNSRGDRMAIFGTVAGEIINIVIFRCAVQDQFSKKRARQVFEEYRKGNTLVDEIQYHPSTSLVSIEENRPKSTFQKFCHVNYYRKNILQITIGDAIFPFQFKRKFGKGSHIVEAQILTK
jgi:hypothetical protein